jgi:hypothetical protein
MPITLDALASLNATAPAVRPAAAQTARYVHLIKNASIFKYLTISLVKINYWSNNEKGARRRLLPVQTAVS